jgi:hypothetical protein
MRFFTWLHTQISLKHEPSSWRTHRPARHFRPRLETLEDRRLPAILSVTSTLDDATRPGTLRYEIAHAANGDTIEMSSLLQGASIVLTQGELLLKKNLTIEGLPNQPETISGNHNSRVFEVAPKATVTLIGLDIIAGNGLANNSSGSNSNNGFGGGILNFGTLTVSDCTLSGNSINNANVAEGGAIYNTGVLTVSNCTLSANSAVSATQGAVVGGGIANVGGTVKVSNSTLSGNSAYDGGGIYTNYGGKVTVINSTLSGNSATHSGGAIWCYVGTVTVSNSTLSGNSASEGGAIYNVDGAYAVTVSKSVFSGNSPDNIQGLYTDGGGNTGLT